MGIARRERGHGWRFEKFITSHGVLLSCVSIDLLTITVAGAGSSSRSFEL